MSEEIQTKTKFEGIVNGQKFDNRDEMEKYVGKLICDGTPINQIEFGRITTLEKVPQIDNPAKRVDAPRAIPGAFVADIEASKPEGIKMPFNKYMVPFINESAFVVDSANQDKPNFIGIDRMVQDGEEKCKRRMDLFVQCVATRIHSPKYVKSEVQEYLLRLRDNFHAKAEWSKSRMDYYAALLEDSKGDNELVNLFACEEGLKVYAVAFSFCKAMEDIISDHLKTL